MALDLLQFLKKVTSKGIRDYWAESKSWKELCADHSLTENIHLGNF